MYRIIKRTCAAALATTIAAYSFAQEPAVEYRYIFQGTGVNALACGPVLAQAPNGDWVSAWLGGGRAEPKPENVAFTTYSTDNGVTWSTPAVALPSPGTILDLYTVENRLVALGFEYDADTNYTVKRPLRLYSDDNARTWSKPEYLQLSRINMAIESHIVLDNGEWLFPAYFMEPRETPLPGGTRREYTHTIGCGVIISLDKGKTFVTNTEGKVQVFGSIDNRDLGLHEPRLVQLKTGRIVMIMRANFGGHNWQATSDDNGRTWSPATQTEIPNPSGKVWVGRVASGKVVLAHNPASKARDPLELWVSDDNMATWSAKLPIDRYERYSELTVAGGRHDPELGWGKGGAWPGNLSYPFVFEKDGKLHIVYDVARRDVVMAIVPSP